MTADQPTTPAQPVTEQAVEEALSDADFGKNDGGFDNGRPERNVRQFIGYLKDRGFVIEREAAVSPEPLDVERLAAAIHAYRGACITRYRKLTCGPKDHMLMAAPIAREYARLASEPTE